ASRASRSTAAWASWPRATPLLSSRPIASRASRSTAAWANWPRATPRPNSRTARSSRPPGSKRGSGPAAPPTPRPPSDGGRPSGRQPFDFPAPRAPSVAKPVVQAVLAALPELESFRGEAVAAPLLGTRWGVAPALRSFLQVSLERIPAFHDLALR